MIKKEMIVGDTYFHGMKVVSYDEQLVNKTVIEFSSAGQLRACYYDEDGSPEDNPLELSDLWPNAENEGNITSCLKRSIGTNINGFCNVAITDDVVKYIKSCIQN